MPETLRRARRIASDEAHAWARNLRLENPNAKLVLSMLALYVNGEGTCFVGIDGLADDTELSPDTVRRRLAWLEQIGAIVRFPQWIDENGRRNSDGRGKRTTDLIKLLIDADPEVIERAAKNDAVESSPSHQQGPTDTSPAISPSSQQGLNSGQPSVSPRLAPAVVLGPESFEPEPEEESPPTPPRGGGQVSIDESLERDLAQAQRDYPAPITNLPRLRALFSGMAAAERDRVLTAMRGYGAYIADCERKKKPRAIKDADRWVASGMWQGYIASGEKAAAAALVTPVAADSPEGKAIVILRKIAHLAPPNEYAGKYLLRQPLCPQTLALLDAPERGWVLITEQASNQIAAWRELIDRELGDIARPQLVWDRNPGNARGFMAPWPWPPRKDGSIGSTGPPPADPLSDESTAAIKKAG